VLRALCAATLLSLPAAAAADGPRHDVSITFSPIFLLLGPIGEASVDVRVLDRLSVAGVAGIGSIRIEVPDESLEDGRRNHPFTFWEIGAQGRFYPIGGFDHGMVLGLQALYVGLSTDLEDENGVRYEGQGNGVALGPFLGYKIVADVGFTFDAQLGVQWVGLLTEAESSAGGRAEGDESDVGPILRLNVGWSL
jgi:hypothetical protein